MAPKRGAKNYVGDYPANPIARTKVLAIGFSDWHQFFSAKNYASNYPVSPIARTKVFARVTALNLFSFPF